jgi:hypothetical protein
MLSRTILIESSPTPQLISHVVFSETRHVLLEIFYLWHISSTTREKEQLQSRFLAYASS